MIKDWPVMLLDENTSTPSGGAPGGPPASSPSDAGAGASPPTQIERTPDSPDEPSPDSFAGMEENDYDSVEIPSEPVQAGEAVPGQPVQPPPAAQPTPATAAPQAAPQAPPAQQPGAPKQDAPSAPRSALDQAIEGFRTNHSELSKWASTQLFALSKEDAEILETDAASFIPVLMGRVYSQALQATSNLIKNFVPNMINEGVTTNNARTARANEALNEFYQANPHLAADKHGALVDKWARAFRAANPNASRADAIKFVGNAVTTELGLTPQSTNGAARRPAPFAPARPGTRAPAPSRPHDPYEGMDMEYDQE